MVVSIMYVSDPGRIEDIAQEFSDNFLNSSSTNYAKKTPEIKKYTENKNSIDQETHKSQSEIQKEMIKEAMDYRNTVTMNFARQLAKKYPGEYNIDQICNIYSFCLKHWSYVSDPNNEEYFQKASETIKTGGNDFMLAGDCDDFAILVATLIKCIGGSSRIILEEGLKSGHAYPQVMVADSKSEMEEIVSNIGEHYSDINHLRVHYEIEKDGSFWLNLDYDSKYPGGEIYQGYNRRIVNSD